MRWNTLKYVLYLTKNLTSSLVYTAWCLVYTSGPPVLVSSTLTKLYFLQLLIYFNLTISTYVRTKAWCVHTKRSISKISTYKVIDDN